MNILYKKHTTISLLIILTIILLSGCRSKKTLTLGGELTKKTHKEIVDDALRTELTFKTLTTKGNVELKAGSSSQKLPAVFKIVKDSILQISIRIPIIGGEAMRVDITPQNIVIIDRLKKQYFTENFKDSEFLKQLDFNFYNLQALLTNKLFIPGKNDLTYNDYDDFKISTTENSYNLQTKGKGSLFYNFVVDASNHLVSTLIEKEKQDLSLQWSYLDFIQDNKFTYPTNLQTIFRFEKKDIGFNISYSKLDIDTDFNVDTSIPKYKKVDFKDLVGSYINLK